MTSPSITPLLVAELLVEGADGNVDRVYNNVFVLRFEPDGRCSEFTEWYVKR